MAINPLDSDYIPSTEGSTKSPPLAKKNIGSHSPSLSPTSHTHARDLVNLSDDQRERQTLFDAVKELPDIREEKVKKIQKALESGQYRIPSEDIADRIIQDTIINNTHKPS